MIKRRSCKITITAFVVLSFISNSSAFAYAKEIPPIEPFENTDRVLIISPHPDDDIIGCAGVIQRALKAGAKVKVVYITCGDNNILSVILYDDLFSIFSRGKIIYLIELILFWKDHFIALGQTRMHEAVRAENVLGLEERDLVFLGYPDHGTDQMFVFNWDHTRPYSGSFGSQTRVPYSKSASYKKDFIADNVIEDIKGVIADFKPTRIFVAHPSDVNGDHWASYLYTMVSLADLGDSIPRPKIYPYLVHVPNWPLPRNYHPELTIEPPEDFFGDALPIIGWRQLKLTAEEISKKHEAMLEHESQTRVSAFYLFAFVRQNEIFGDFPYIKLKRQSSSGLSAKDIFAADTQWIGYAVVDGSLWVRVKVPQELEDGTDLTFFIAGFREDIPFARMPNILVSAKSNKFDIFDATDDKYIRPEGASLEVDEGSVIFKIPLAVLGDPKGLLFGIEMDEDYMPEGCTAFRVIEIE